MKKSRKITLTLFLLALLTLVPVSPGISAKGTRADFTTNFFLEDCTFSSRGSNTYFILKTGYQLVLGGEVRGTSVRLTITVLDETKIVGGVETRVVEERETDDGETVEVSRNYFAICNQTNSVFYFGEDVDLYQNGQIVSHEGSWLAGVNGAKAGLVMPGIILLGAGFYQEMAPGVAIDRAEIVSMSEVVPTPAGTFSNCLKSEETSALKGGREYKFYAPQVGIIKDAGLLLMSHGFLK